MTIPLGQKVIVVFSIFYDAGSALPPHREFDRCKSQYWSNSGKILRSVSCSPTQLKTRDTGEMSVYPLVYVATPTDVDLVDYH